MKWVWSARPEYAFEPDGSTPPSLQPVDVVLPEHYDDENGWWTCHKNTKIDDLAVLYRSGTANTPGDLPARGPKSLCQVILATSNAFPLSDEPLAGEFADFYGCHFVTVAQLEPPVEISTLKADPVQSGFPALKAGFVKAAMPMPEDNWRRLMTMDGGTGGQPQVPNTQLTPGERSRLEIELENWLESRPDQLDMLLGAPCSIVGRQIACGNDHGGVMDLLVRRLDKKDNFTVLELKADTVKRDAAAQALGYVGWLRAQRGVKHAAGVVVGLDVHSQVPWVLATAPDAVSVRHWKNFDLPADLRSALNV